MGVDDPFPQDSVLWLIPLLLDQAGQPAAYSLLAWLGTSSRQVDSSKTTERVGWDCHNKCLKGSEGPDWRGLPRDPIQLQNRQWDYPGESEQPNLTHQHEDVSQIVQCRRKWTDSGSVMGKGLQIIGGFINASHFNFWLEKRRKCGLELKLVE